MRGFQNISRFVGTGLLWGSSYMWIAIALESFSWQMLTWLRPIIGVVTLAIFIFVRKLKNPTPIIFPRDKKIWLHLFVVGFFLTFFPSIFSAIALTGISSSLVSVYTSALTLATAVFSALVFRIEKLRGLNWLGIVFGFVGVILVINPWGSDNSANFLSQLFVLISVLAVGFAYAYQQRFLGNLDLDPLVAAFILTLGAALMEVLATPWVFIVPPSVSMASWLALLVLGVGVGAIAYVWNAAVLQAWGATGASMVNYLNPVVGVLLGTLVLGEEFTPLAGAGATVIFIGIAVDRFAKAGKQSQK